MLRVKAQFQPIKKISEKIMKTFIKNPLDELFDVSNDEMSGYDEVQASALVPAEQTGTPAQPEVKDQEDTENDQRFDEVYTAAKTAFDNQMAYTEIIEPRYAARNAEVAANFLNLALQAAATKARVKTDRKRATAFIPGAAGSKITNNTIVASREEILRMISVDAETKELK